MIRANELRLGNWVEYPHYNDDGTVKYFKIRDIYTDDDKISLTDGRIQLPSSNLKYINPIPLTEEWLLKLGFNKVSINYENRNVALWHSSYLKCYVFRYGHNGEIRIDFVYQLQNLYFALTGEELEVKP